VDCTHPDPDGYDYQAEVTSDSTIWVAFVVVANPVSPVISSVDPLEFELGESKGITIDGSGFQAWSTVWIDGTTEIVPATVTPTQITATVPASAIDSCEPISITVWNYDGTGGFSNAVVATAMHNLEAIEYSLAWAGFGGPLDVDGWGFTAGNEGRWKTLADADIGNTMTAAVADQNNLTLTVDTTDLVQGTLYYLYVDDTSGYLCEPLEFMIDQMIPDTGQTDLQCTDGGGPFEPCSGTDPSYFGQDGHHQLPPRQHDYTLDVNGAGDDDDLVTDNISGLTWMACPAGSGATPSCASPAEITLAAATTFCDDLSLDGHSNWRLPTLHELMTIVDASQADPSIDMSYFESPITVFILDPYWADAPHPTADYSATWSVTVDFKYGKNENKPNTENHYVRCVTDTTSALTPNLSIETANIVLDDATHLMWTKEADGPGDWQAALAGCEGLNLDGYDDWRLPDRNELMTLLDLTVQPGPTYAECIDTSFFSEAVESDEYWTSSSFVDDPGYAWRINFAAMSPGAWEATKTTDTYNYRCVRSDRFFP
jgi:hypothetical protein